MLNDVPKNNFFWLSNVSIKNYKELSEKFTSMSQESYIQYANTEKNDFARWVKDLKKDIKLSNELIKSKTPKTASKKVNDPLLLGLKSQVSCEGS